MTIIEYIRTNQIALDHRWFGFFLVLQVVGVALVVFDELLILLLAIGAAAAAIFFAYVIVYPWLIIPLIIGSTAMDITGQLEKSLFLDLPLTGFHVAFLLMLIAMPVNICIRRTTHFPDFELKGPLFFFLGIMAISLTYSPNQPEATINFVRVALLVLFMYLTQILIYDRQAIKVVVYSMTIGVLAGSVMGAYQVATGEFHLPVSMVGALGANVPRATGTFHNPNIFASFLVGGVIPLLGLVLNHRLKLWQQLVLGLTCVVGFLGTLITFSRSNWVSLAAGAFVVLWLSKKLRYLFYLIVVVFVVIVSLSSFVPFAAYIFDRFISIFTIVEEFGTMGRTSSTTRIYLVLTAWEMWLDNPVIGIGWRGFPTLINEYAPPGYPWWSLVDEPHTVVAAVAAELGLVGLIAFVWFVVRTLRLSLIGLREMEDSFLRALMIGMISVFAAFQVNQMFNGDYSNNMFWFYIGLMFSILRIERELRVT